MFHSHTTYTSTCASCCMIELSSLSQLDARIWQRAPSHSDVVSMPLVIGEGTVSAEPRVLDLNIQYIYPSSFFKRIAIGKVASKIKSDKRLERYALNDVWSCN
ncbi:hypothetical protein M3J07_009866 [Ascochyta lentis]